MLYFTSLAEVPPDFGPSAVAFGKFDGVHLGHRTMIDALARIGAERGLVPAVLTFDRNPLAVLDPAHCPESISSRRQRRELLDAAGVGALLELPFDREFSSQSAKDFVERIIVGTLHAEVVLVGPDPRFGAGGRGRIDTLTSLGRQHGFEVQQVAAHDDADERVSSTRVRELLREGQVADAGRLLGRDPSVRGIVVHGEKRGRELGYPTANLSPELEGLIPADGVYAGYLTVVQSPAGASVVREGERMPAAISVGNNPTFLGVPQRQVEAHVLDADLDLYDREVLVEFTGRVRGMEKFDSLDALVARMDLDAAHVRSALT